MQIVQLLLMSIIPLILAITLHEAAHGWVAKKLGDNTAYSLGRVSLNPLVHIDPIGTILVPAVLFVMTGFAFGWAKPVPVREGNLRNPKRDGMYVALAGPMANLLMAIMWLIIAKLTQSSDIDYFVTVYKIASLGIVINISFMVFNLIPILPLDGGRVLLGLLPFKAGLQFSKTEQYGQWIVLILAVTGILSIVVTPIVGVILGLLNVF